MNKLKRSTPTARNKDAHILRLLYSLCVVITYVIRSRQMKYNINA